MLFQCLLGRISALTLHTPEVKSQKKQKVVVFASSAYDLLYQPTNNIPVIPDKYEHRMRTKCRDDDVCFYDMSSREEEENICNLLCPSCSA